MNNRKKNQKLPKIEEPSSWGVQLMQAGYRYSQVGYQYLSGIKKQVELIFSERARKLVALHEAMGKSLSFTPYLLDKEKTNELIMTIENLIPELPINHADTHLILMRLYLMLEKKEEALTQFKKAIVENPKNPLPYFEMGKYFQQKNQNQEAIDYLTRAIELFGDDDHLTLQFGRGTLTTLKRQCFVHRYQALWRLGRLEDAREDLWEAQNAFFKEQFNKELDRLEKEIQDRENQHKQKMEKEKKERQWLDQDINPELEKIFFEASLALKNKDKMFSHIGAQHIDKIQFFLDMRPQDYFLRLLKTELLEAFVWDARVEIKKELEYLLQLEPNNPIAYVALSRYFQIESKLDRAIELLSIALEKIQNQDLFEIQYGAQGQVFSRRVSQAGIYSWRASVYEKSGQYEKALADHEKTTSLYPGDEKKLLDQHLARCRDAMAKSASSSSKEIVENSIHHQKEEPHNTRLPGASLMDKLLYFAHDQARQAVNECPNFLSNSNCDKQAKSAYQAQNLFAASSAHLLSGGIQSAGICYQNGTEGVLRLLK